MSDPLGPTFTKVGYAICTMDLCKASVPDIRVKWPNGTVTMCQFCPRCDQIGFKG